MADTIDPPRQTRWRPRETNMREAINAILYPLRTGCPWRYLPRETFPPRSTVYNIFHNFQKAGVWDSTTHVSEPVDDRVLLIAPSPPLAKAMIKMCGV